MNKKFHIYKDTDVDDNLRYYIDFDTKYDTFWEIRCWCNNNIKYTWKMLISDYNKCTVHYIFDTEIDFMAFKLRWM